MKLSDDLNKSQGFVFLVSVPCGPHFQSDSFSPLQGKGIN